MTLKTLVVVNFIGFDKFMHILPLYACAYANRPRAQLNNQGGLRHIQKFEYWSLEDVLREKYRYTETDAKMISSFLLPMLSWLPADRIAARDAIKHPWLECVYAQIDGAVNSDAASNPESEEEFEENDAEPRDAEANSDSEK